MNEMIGLTFMAIGLFFNFAGAVGLVRLPDLYNRLQAATKCATLGTCAILLGAFLIFPTSQEGLKSLLCIVFILLTAPTAAHAIARGAYHYGVPLWEGSVVDRYKADAGKREN